MVSISWESLLETTLHVIVEGLCRCSPSCQHQDLNQILWLVRVAIKLGGWSNDGWFVTDVEFDPYTEYSCFYDVKVK